MPTNLRLFLLVFLLNFTNPVSAAAPVLGEASAPVAGVIYGSVIRTTDAEELRYYVLRGLTDRYAAQKGIKVSRAEIDRYEHDVDAFMKADAAKRGVPRDVASVAVTAEEKAARDWIATAFIKQWKINRALHREFGGRVIFQQGGPEPLDAYRKFLEVAQERGDFLIADRTLDDAFWQYYRDDKRHSFMPANAMAQAFGAPPWAKR